jgi:ElaB/YqjD/DUF883 family membrane-anchored ribosome-binding protein
MEAFHKIYREQLRKGDKIMETNQMASGNTGAGRSAGGETRHGAASVGEKKVIDSPVVLANGLARARDQLVTTAQAEIEQMRVVGQKIAQRSGDYVRQMEKVVRTRPLTSVAVAAGVSALAVYSAMRLMGRAERH